MKKIAALLLVAVLLLGLVACASKQTTPEEKTPAESQTEVKTEEKQSEQEKEDEKSDKPLRFILSNAYYTAPYCAAYNPAAEAKAKELGVELTILDANSSQQTALEHANMAINDNYDGFMYFSADVDGAPPVIEALNDSGIAWIGVNSFDGSRIEEFGMEYFVGPDSKSHGVTMAKYLKEAFPDGANVVAIEGTAGHNQTVQINAAFAEELDDKYVFMDQQDCNFQPEQAMTKMTDMITAYGLSSKGGKIDCIISHDGGMVTGIISALEAAGYQPGDVKIIACGSNKVVYDALQSGWLTATSTQDPSSEAAEAVEVLYDIVTNGGKYQSGWTKTETPLATKENADQFNWF